MGTERVRWGIIGCGSVVERKSGPALQRTAQSEVVTVSQRAVDSVEKFARRHGVPCWTTDADELIHNPKVDAVYVATPPGSH